MPQTFKIKTDKGVISFGAVVHSSEMSSDIGRVGFTGTDLIDLSGATIVSKINPDPSDYRWMNLSNGNRIGVAAFKDPRYNHLFCNVTFEDTLRGQTAELGLLMMVNYSFARPQFYLSQFNNFNTSAGEWGVTTPVNNKNYIMDGSKDESPYTFPKYKNAKTAKATISSEYGKIAWLVEFCKGAIVPNFPGPDNEKDPEGGDGEGPEGIEDDPIEFPEKPGITVTDAGLMTLYTPTQGQIHAFGDFLWSDAFSLDTFKKLFADPMQAVIGLSIVPVAVPTAGAQPITIGAISSGVTANRAASQYVVHDCGTLKVNPIWNTALDFSPYTKFSIYLPFIGTRELKTDDIMGKELNVKYFVDVLSGACTAHISVGGSVLYQFSGSCATPVPLSAMNWNSTLTSMIQLAGAGIAMAVTGGAAAPAAAGMLTTATGMIGNKPNVQRSGAVSGAAGMLGVKTPYLIRETPRQSLAKDYAHYSGYPSNITAVLGTLKGFTMVENMHLKNIDATADELDEIETALKEGVIL